MESKTILFTVDGDNISPRTEQKAGVQGSHNVTEVRFNVEEDLVLGALQENPTSRIRMQFIDGAGGFYSTGFLDAMAEILPDESAQYYVTCPIPSTVTNAGGIAKVYLVITEIVYGVEDGPAYEEQVFISSAAKISFEGSGIGSPSEYQYRQGISSALVNAEIFVGQAENASGAAKEYRDSAETFCNEAGNYQSKAGMHASNAETSAGNAKTYATNAETSAGNAAESATSAEKSKDSANHDAVSANIAASVAQSRAEEAANSLQELKDGIANGKFKGEPGTQGPQGPQGLQGPQGEKGEKGETPDLSGYATKEELAEAIGLALEGDY